MMGYRELNCPECENNSLRQKRVRVFPQVSVPSPEGCTVVEQDSGSTLVVRIDDLEFQRPGADTSPAITVVYECETCGADDMRMHLGQRGGYSCWFWDIPGMLPHDLGVGRPPSETESQRVERLRAEVDTAWDRYMNPERHGFSTADTRSLLMSYQRAVHTLQSVVRAMRNDDINI